MSAQITIIIRDFLGNSVEIKAEGHANEHVGRVLESALKAACEAAAAAGIANATPSKK